MKLRWIAALLVVVIAAVFVGISLQARSLPNIILPLKSLEAYSPSDGGSIVVRIIDANDAELYFGIEGSIDNPQSEQLSFFINKRYWLGLKISPAPGGRAEFELMELAKKISSYHFSKAKIQQIKNNDFGDFSDEELNYAMIYAIYGRLSVRHASN